MSEINLPPFYIGQKVVCLFDGINYIKGNVYTVASQTLMPCCKNWKIGCAECPLSANEIEEYFCCACGAPPQKIPGLGEYYWVLSAKHFAPIQENFQSISLEKILEEETKLIGVN